MSRQARKPQSSLSFPYRIEMLLQCVEGSSPEASASVSGASILSVVDVLRVSLHIFCELLFYVVDCDRDESRSRGSEGTGRNPLKPRLLLGFLWRECTL